MRKPNSVLFFLVAAAVAGALLAGCDNVGRVFDPEFGTPPGAASTVQPMVVGGDAVDLRPTVRNVEPSGFGWPETVPIVVEFSESMNPESIAGSGGGSPLLFVRALDSETPLPASYDFLLGNTVVVIRPAAPLVPPPSGTGTTEPAEFEIVIDPAAADLDGVTFGGAAPRVLGSFTVDEGVSMSDDGAVMATVPINQSNDRTRETPIYAIFTKPVDEASVTGATFTLEDQNGVAVPATPPTFPIGTGPLTDLRIARLDPTDVLVGGTQFTIRLRDGITFNEGAGDLLLTSRNNIFTTIPQTAPISVAVGNAPMGFPDKINRGNLENLLIDVDVDASAAAGDTVTVRIYGSQASTADPDDVNFVQATGSVPAAGMQTITVPFVGALGSVDSPIFDEGDLVLAAQISRGSSQRSGYILSSANNTPELDVTQPTLTAVSPSPNAGTFDLATDLQQVALFGQADEELGGATLTAGAATLPMFGSDSGGGFLMVPLDLQLRTTPLAYQLTIVDTAGNMSATAADGMIIPLGIVSGSVSGGMLTVEAYDDATLQVIPNATVLIEPGLPQKPAVGRLTMATGVDGRATFTGLAQPSYTITVVAPGYDLKTLLDTGAGHASLGLRPTSAATATFGGTTVGFTPAFQATALIGHNLLDDPVAEAIQTSVADPTAIPTASIRPNRPQVITGFGGNFEPIALPAFVFQGCQLCGVTGVMATAPLAPVPAGGNTTATLVLSSVAATTSDLAAPYQVDFNLAAGLNTASLVGNPTVRVRASLLGLPGMALLGVGAATPVMTGTYSATGTYSLTASLTLLPFTPLLYTSAQATDTAGNTSRSRAVIDTINRVALPLLPPLGIPTITPSGGPSIGSPAVTYQDRLDPGLLPGTFGFVELTATDAGGRGWTVLRQDGDGATGAVTIQLPDLTGAGVTGLALGTWSVRAETRALVSAAFATDRYVFEEMRRQQIAYARAASESFTVN